MQSAVELGRRADERLMIVDNQHVSVFEHDCMLQIETDLEYGRIRIWLDIISITTVGLGFGSIRSLLVL